MTHLRTLRLGSLCAVAPSGRPRRWWRKREKVGLHVFWKCRRREEATRSDGAVASSVVVGGASRYSVCLADPSILSRSIVWLSLSESCTFSVPLAPPTMSLRIALTRAQVAAPRRAAGAQAIRAFSRPSQVLRKDDEPERPAGYEKHMVEVCATRSGQSLAVCCRMVARAC